MITKVRLKNWRSHLDSELNFSSGTNVLVGILGSGKTSVLDAICFALFGTFPTLQTRKLKIDDVIMNKPVQKNRSEVEVEFKINGATYSVKRVIERGRGTSYSELRENGKLVESPSTQRVTEAVEKLLKVNYELFSKAIYSEQNALDYFLTLGRGQRMKKIDELLMINKFEKVRANAVALTNKIVERKLAKQNVLESADVKNTEAALTELKKTLSTIEEQREVFRASLNETRAQKAKLEKEVAELHNIKDELEELKRVEKGLSSAAEELKTAMSELKEAKGVDENEIEQKLNALSENMEKLSTSIDEKRRMYEQLQKRVGETRANIEFLRREKIERLEKEVEEKLEIKRSIDKLMATVGVKAGDVDREIEKRKYAVEKLVGKAEALRVKIKDLKETLDKLMTAKGKCPVCDSELTEERKRLLIRQKHTQIKTFEKEVDSLGKSRQITEAELKRFEAVARQLHEMLTMVRDLDKMKHELERSKSEFAENEKIAADLKEQLSKLKREIEDMQEESKKLTNEKQKLEIFSLRLKDYEKKRMRLNEVLKRRQQLTERIVGMEEKLANKELEKLEEWLKNLIAKEKEIETRIASLGELAKEKEIRIREYEQSLAVLKKEKEEIERLDRLIKELKIFTEALKHTQIELRENFVEGVNYSMQQLWQTLYPYKDFVGIRLAIEEGDYVLQLQERGGRWVNVEGIASGGERSIACLALRIAFALVLAPQLRWLVLDEPTANLDANAVEDLAVTLRERIGEFVDQVFIITHNERLEEAVTGNLYRLERKKAEDGVTRVISNV